MSRRAFLRRTSVSALQAVGSATVAVGLSGTLPLSGRLAERTAAAASGEPPLSIAPSRSTPNLIAARRLGRTGLTVHPIAFGAGSLNPSRAELLRAALSAGVDLIDTSPAYGEGASEETLGRVLAERGSAGRDRVVLLTKEPGLDWDSLLGERQLGDRQLGDRPHDNTPLSDAAIQRLLTGSVEGSLRRLRTDRLDVLAVPASAARAELGVPSDGLRRALEQLRSAGKVRFFALATSDHAAAATARAAIRGGFYDVVLTVLNAATLDAGGRFRALVNARVNAAVRRDAPSTSPNPTPNGRRGLPPVPADDASDLPRLAAEHDVGLLAMRAAHTRFIPAELDAAVQRTFGQPGLSRHQALYRAVLAHPEIAAVLVGVQTPEHLREALALSRELHSRDARERDPREREPLLRESCSTAS